MPASHIVLTASTSESYSLLFKLLCDPGESVLVPTPSYPLFEHLTRLDSVHALPYAPNITARGPSTSTTCAMRSTRRRGRFCVVNPNNPTGGWLKRDELRRWSTLCAAHHLVLIGDEVFCRLSDRPGAGRRAQHHRRRHDVLTVGLGGLSKSAGLPQLKLGWIALRGPASLLQPALMRLEIVADTYLSVRHAGAGGAPAS